MTLYGYQVVASDAMVETIEDWSKCRAPSRARRREKKYPQHVVRKTVPRKDCLIYKDKIVIMHPSILQEFRAQCEKFSASWSSSPFTSRR